MPPPPLRVGVITLALVVRAIIPNLGWVHQTIAIGAVIGWSCTHLVRDDVTFSMSVMAIARCSCMSGEAALTGLASASATQMVRMIKMIGAITVDMASAAVRRLMAAPRP